MSVPLICWGNVNIFAFFYRKSIKSFNVCTKALGWYDMIRWKNFVPIYSWKNILIEMVYWILILNTMLYFWISYQYTWQGNTHSKRPTLKTYKEVLAPCFSINKKMRLLLTTTHFSHLLSRLGSTKYPGTLNYYLRFLPNL